MMQTFLPLLQAGKRKTVVNISSSFGSLSAMYKIVSGIAASLVVYTMLHRYCHCASQLREVLVEVAQHKSGVVHAVQSPRREAY